MQYSLSDKDICNVLSKNGIKHKLITYPELTKYKSLVELLYPYNVVVICYLTRENYGHWVCLFTNKYGINFFDSYGIIPDDELNWKIDENFRKISNEDYPHLIALMYNSRFPIHYNQYQFQAKIPGIATCGRHVIARLCLKKLSTDEYKDIIRKCCENLRITADQLVVLLVQINK
jgi:hypothetical protein